ncbi:MAG: galactose mutarotase [Spirochaetales bacterium]|nr:galactose mutarotase [Spirochaetales bacterium]
MIIEGKTYGKTVSGDRIDRVTVSNSSGLSISAISYGATLISVKTPDRDGNIEEITLGKSDFSGYEDGHPYFGSTVGRVCNRIANGKFSLGGIEYSLPKNNGPNCLHGGPNGFDKMIWDIFPFKEEKKAGVKFSYISADGEEGFPGTLDIMVTYTLTEDSELLFDYEAVCDMATPVNLTNHVYWNLSGPESTDILNHRLKLNCESFLPVNEVMIPTGEIKDVTGTPFDFRKEKTIGSGIDEAGGYDHCFTTSCYKPGEDGLSASENCFPASENEPFAVLSDGETGRKLELFTSQPGVQLYSGNFLNKEPGRLGDYSTHSGLCLETQNFPDSPNQPNFPSSILLPGKNYKHQTMIRFGIVK